MTRPRNEKWVYPTKAGTAAGWRWTPEGGWKVGSKPATEEDIEEGLKQDYLVHILDYDHPDYQDLDSEEAETEE